MINISGTCTLRGAGIEWDFSFPTIDVYRLQMKEYLHLESAQAAFAKDLELPPLLLPMMRVKAKERVEVRIQIQAEGSQSQRPRRQRPDLQLAPTTKIRVS